MSTRSETTTKPAEVGLSGRKIIYDEDGKPCRACNTLLDFQFVTGKLNTVGGNKGSTVAKPENAMAATAATAVDSSGSQGNELIPGSESYTKADPPDVEQLGRSSWNLLHSIAARYPNKPSPTQKQEMKQFMTIFSHVYPCSWCASDFEKFITDNSPNVESKEELGRWMCRAHNEVNAKLGKEEFNCDLWRKRWVDGWE